MYVLVLIAYTIDLVRLRLGDYILILGLGSCFYISLDVEHHEYCTQYYCSPQIKIGLVTCSSGEIVIHYS